MIPIDPALPPNFYSTANDKRPKSHMRWWGKPYIVTRSRLACVPESQWLAAWPEGVRYDVYCLDGQCWDRPTSLGQCSSLDAALALASNYSDVAACR